MKLKILFLSVFFIYTGISVKAQTSLISKADNGNIVKSIIVTGPVSVELIEATDNLLEATGSNEFINNIHVSWAGEVLRVNFSGEENSHNTVIKVYVTTLNHIQAEEGAKIVTPKPLHSSNILVRIIGNGYAKIVNYGGIRITGDENATVSNFRYQPE